MIDVSEFYKDPDDKWHWRRTVPNGNIVGAATQGYNNKNDCEGNATRNGWNKEHSEIKYKALELYAKHGFKDGNDFVDWLEAEKLVGKFGDQNHNAAKTMMAPKWSNIKTSINKTFQELRKEVHGQIVRRLKDRIRQILKLKYSIGRSKIKQFGKWEELDTELISNWFGRKNKKQDHKKCVNIKNL